MIRVLLYVAGIIIPIAGFTWMLIQVVSLIRQ